MKTMIELRPINGRKSFYGKCGVYQENGEVFLRSYNTDVCKVNKDGEFIRIWDGYSQTTMTHINAFLSYVGIYGGGKAWWDKQEVKTKGE